MYIWVPLALKERQETVSMCDFDLHGGGESHLKFPLLFLVCMSVCVGIGTHVCRSMHVLAEAREQLQLLSPTTAPATAPATSSPSFF